MSNGKQTTGNLRWAELESGEKVLQQQFGLQNGWAWSGLEWVAVPTVKLTNPTEQNLKEPTP